MSPTCPTYGTAFTANPAQKTTLVKAVFDGAHFTIPDGQALPKTRAGAPVTLRVKLNDLLDKDQARHRRTALSRQPWLHFIRAPWSVE